MTMIPVNQGHNTVFSPSLSPARLHQWPAPSSTGCMIYPSCSVQISMGENWWLRTPLTAPVTGPLRRTPPQQTMLSSAGWPPSTLHLTRWWPTPTAASATTRTSRRTTTSSTVELGTPSLAVSHFRELYRLKHLEWFSSVAASFWGICLYRWWHSHNT